LFFLSGKVIKGKKEHQSKLQRELSINMNKRLHQHFVGNVELPVDECKEPEEIYSARDRDPAHVTELYTSFTQTGTCRELSKVVAFLADGAREVDGNAPNRFYDYKTIHDAVDGYYMITGDHGREAQTRLHRDFPNNPSWNLINAKLYVMHRTPENYQTLVFTGVQDNMIQQVQKKMSFKDKFKKIRAMAILVGSNAKEKKIWLTNFATMFKESEHSIGQLWSYARKSPPVVERMIKMMNGDVPEEFVKQFKIPSAMTNFNQMGGIPDADLIGLMDDVIKATCADACNMPVFKQSCIQYKMLIRIRAEILKMARNDLRKAAKKAGQDEEHIDQSGQTDWDDDFCDKFPRTTDELNVQQWLVQMVNNNVGVKGPMPAGMASALRHDIQQDLRTGGQETVMRRAGQDMVRCSPHFNDVFVSRVHAVRQICECVGDPS
jgi:hypothetical protein